MKTYSQRANQTPEFNSQIEVVNGMDIDSIEEESSVFIFAQMNTLRLD
jgi:hypothetical protein